MNDPSMSNHRNVAQFVFLLVHVGIGHVLCAQEHHPLDGAMLPTRATLRSIAVEQWQGLPKGYKLPAHVDLSPLLPPPGDQGRQNSCIASNSRTFSSKRSPTPWRSPKLRSARR